ERPAVDDRAVRRPDDLRVTQQLLDQHPRSLPSAPCARYRAPLAGRTDPAGPAPLPRQPRAPPRPCPPPPRPSGPTPAEARDASRRRTPGPPAPSERGSPDPGPG